MGIRMEVFEEHFSQWNIELTKDVIAALDEGREQLYKLIIVKINS